MSAPCPFCYLDPARVFLDTPLVLGIWDAFPVAPGHALLIPRRHVATWFDATADEHAAILAAIPAARAAIERTRRPDGYNLGANVGPAAGQTVLHLHFHVIPRYHGDVPDPRGGVRHVVPAKANYLAGPGAAAAPARTDPLTTGGTDDPFSAPVLRLFDRATEIAIVAAFVQRSGLDRLHAAMLSALRRGAHVRLVAGDYLEITQAEALEALLDLSRRCAADDDDDDDEQLPGTLETRVIETARLPKGVLSFHPKSWRFEGPAFGIAYVGSSNLSRTALDAGIEWNLCVERERDPAAYGRVAKAFDDIWERARPLDATWVEAYAARAREQSHDLPAGDAEAEPAAPPPEPHEVQRDALAALQRARDEGRKRAVVVLATGLGKTWLAAFDYAAGLAPPGHVPRLLFLAHRRELLLQAARTFRSLMQAKGVRARVGWFVEEKDDLSAHLVFASVAKLARPGALERLRREAFDFVVVDEVHHAAADSYRRILAVLDPGFLLGLTATPDRADSADLLGLFDDFIAYRADIPRGIGMGRLVPFHYFGVKDDIDYANIPWRNRRLDPAALSRAAETEARMATLWDAWQVHPGTRSLVFCCSISHAVFVRAWLRARGVRVAAVFSAEGSDDRGAAIKGLAAGELDAVLAVDVFNEGIDVPSIDRVVMLRPTESSVVFLQQLGRGLRAAEGKNAVTVLDFVGNHRVFLERLRTLLSLAGQGATALRDFLSTDAPAEFPAGCSVDIELEAKDLLARLFKPGGADEVERAYRELADERGADEDPSQRPTAGELHRLGFQPARLRDRHGSWFEFVRGEGHLSAAQTAAWEAGAPFLRELETTEMTKCFKMVTLQVMLDAGALDTGMPLGDIAARSYAFLRRSPDLSGDLDDAFPERHSALPPEFPRYWRKNPIAAWTLAKARRRAWFAIQENRLTLDFSLDTSLRPAFEQLVRELVDYRLAQYRARRRETAAGADGFVCRVLWNQRDPILKLPPRADVTLPESETDVRLPDGSVWQFRFAREFCNVARPVGAPRNQLPDLLRRWFGPRTGQPGTSHQVRFRAAPSGLWAEPIAGEDLAALPRVGIVAYPDLRAAAGEKIVAFDAPSDRRVWLPGPATQDLFAVRVSGSSMDGGRQPLRDGDWAVFRLGRSLGESAVENRVVLVETPGAAHGATYQIKRAAREGAGWRFTSDNPEGPSFPASGDTVIIARLERALAPEALGPSEGSVLADDQLAAAFGLEELPAATGRHAGHLFVFISEKEMLVAPDRVRIGVEPRPSETAFVLALRDNELFRYLGVARQTQESGVWSLTDVDSETWRRWGTGRSASRPLPEGLLAQAQLAVDALLAGDPGSRWITRVSGQKARIVGRSEKGGLRVDGGRGGFQERTVSLPDLAWVIAADGDAEANGGTLDEDRVNRHRYLEGTPKGSTRWIDTGWAIAAWIAVREQVREALVALSGASRIRRDDGASVDASFRIERVDGRETIVFESRGGTRGTAAARNTEYGLGLRLLLERLGRAAIRIADVHVESRETERLPIEGRRVELEGMAYPLAVDDAEAVRRALASGQAKVGRAPGAKGAGNRTRRLRIFLEGVGPRSAGELRALLGG